MLKTNKTQFAIRKLTTGTGILLLSVGMGINLSSKKVEAAETTSIQTSENIQSETDTEVATNQVELPTSTQETSDTSLVNEPSSVEVKETVTEVPGTTVDTPTEAVTPEKTETIETVTPENAETPEKTETTEPVPETETPEQNTEAQTPATIAPTTPSETEEVDTDEKSPAENDTVTETDKVTEEDKSETDADKEEKEESDEKSDKKDKNDWLDKYRPTWDKIDNQDEFLGWENIFGTVDFIKVPSSSFLDPRWESTVGKEITITQTVNGVSQDITVKYDVVITIKPHLEWNGIFPTWNNNFVITDVKVTSKEYENGKDKFDAVDIPEVGDGYENKVTGTVTSGNVSSDIDVSANIKDNQIQTILSDELLNSILQKGENVTFNYTIEKIAIKKPTWSDVIDGDNDKKEDWNDIFKDVEFEERDDGAWSGKVTLNKDIIQIINGSQNTQTIGKEIIITIKRDGNTNQFKISTVKDTGWSSLGSIDISKPGHTYDKDQVSASINDNKFTDFTIENDALTPNLNGIKLENNNNSVTINYTVDYKPDLSGVTLPDGFDKDDLEKQPDGTWTGSTTTNKVITQTVNNGASNQVTLSQAVSVTLTWNGSKWEVDDKTEYTTSNNSININKPGYTYDKNQVSASVNNNAFIDFTVKDDGTITITADANIWNTLKDNDTINYTVDYKLDLTNVTLPDGFNKDNLEEQPDGSWIGSTTIDKVITQTVNNGASNQITLSQTVSVTLTWDADKQEWVVNDKTEYTTSNNSININKPGYIYDKVSASINNNAFTNFEVNADGTITITANADIWNTLNDKDTINYTVDYKLDLTNVTLPDGFDKDDLEKQLDGSWSGSTTTNKVVTQTVNNGASNQVTLSQIVSVTLTWNESKWNVETETDYHVTDNESININKPGYTYDKNQVSASINNNTFIDFTVEDDGTIKVNADAWNNLNDKDVINYTVDYKLDLSGVTLPDGFNKDDLKEQPDGSWSGTTTANKVVTQTVNNGEFNQVTLSQTVSVTLTWNADKWDVKHETKYQVQNDNPININKPGYTYDKVSASVNNKDFNDFKIKDDGIIIITADAWNSLKDKDTINYTVNYKLDLTNVTLPDGFNKDDLKEQPDGSWTGTTTNNKVVTQTVNNGESNQVILSQTVSVTLTWNQKGQRWDVVDKAEYKVLDNNPININKPGYTYDKLVASVNNNAFTNFKVNAGGTIAITDNAWNSLKDNDTINYTVDYKLDLSGVTLPDGFNKDDLKEQPDGSWTGSTTTNKVVVQTVNNRDSNQVILSQTVSVTLTWNGSNWDVKHETKYQVQNDNPININRPGYTYDKVSASVNNNEFTDFIVEDDGTITITDAAWNSLNNNDTINYTVDYKLDLTGVTLPNGFNKDDLKEQPDGTWAGTTTTNKVVTQTVNNGESNQVTLSQTVSVTLTWNAGKQEWEVKADTNYQIQDQKPININKPGYTYQVSASVNNNKFTDFTVKDGTITITDDAWNSFNNGDTIDYTVKYDLDLTDVELPDGFDKDDLDKQPDGTWTGNITTDKVVTQTVGNRVSNQVILSQIVSVTLTWNGSNWDVKHETKYEIKNDNPININKPGYTYDKVSASINNINAFADFIVEDNGTITITDNAWNSLKDKDVITYTVNYKPITPQPGTVTTPDKDDNIWSDTNVTDKEKDDIFDKIENDGLNWSQNEDGTWFASISFNKQLSQSITGNMIDNPLNTNLDITKTVTLIAELKGDKFHITSVQSGKWTSTDDLEHELPASDNKYDISASVNGTNHTGLKEEVENINTIPGLNNDLIQSIINDHEYGSILALSYVINANSGSIDADPNRPAEPDTPNVDPDIGVTPDDSKPAEPDTPNVDPDMGVTPDDSKPDTPNVDPDMGVTPENPSNPGYNDGSNNSGNNSGSSDSTENTEPKPEESPKDETNVNDSIRPLPEKVDDDKNSNQNTDSSQSKSDQNNTVTSGNTANKKAVVVPLSESSVVSQSNNVTDDLTTAKITDQATLPQTGEENSKLTTMGIIMAGLANALTTLGMAIKKKKN